MRGDWICAHERLCGALSSANEWRNERVTQRECVSADVARFGTSGRRAERCDWIARERRCGTLVVRGWLAK